jgi:hypothetical protein
MRIVLKMRHLGLVWNRDTGQPVDILPRQVPRRRMQRVNSANRKGSFGEDIAYSGYKVCTLDWRQRTPGDYENHLARAPSQARSQFNGEPRLIKENEK